MPRSEWSAKSVQSVRDRSQQLYLLRTRKQTALIEDRGQTGRVTMLTLNLTLTLTLDLDL